MEHKFIIVYLSWILSTLLYVFVCSIASETQEQFYLLLSFGLMIAFFVFLCLLTFFFDASS
jgi:hypothetical protein